MLCTKILKSTEKAKKMVFYRIVSMYLLAIVLTACGGDGTVSGNLDNIITGGESENDDSGPQFASCGTADIPIVTNFNPGLLYPTGIEPGIASECEATAPNRCWWVDGNAADSPTADGTFNDPYNSFEIVTGYRSSSTFTAGQMTGGDHIYVTGTFDMNNHVINGGKSIQLYLGRPEQGGTAENPTVIKSYKGQARAVFDGDFLTGIANTEGDQAGLIVVQTSSNTPIDHVLIQNVEVKNADGLGINIGERALTVTIESVIVHDTALRLGSANSGGIKLTLKQNSPLMTVKNSLLYGNYRNPGGADFFSSSNNNYGGINILGGNDSEDESKVIIKDNIILDEYYSIRHKKSANIESEIETNIIDTARVAFYARSYKSNIFRHNLVRNISTPAVVIDAENQNGDLCIGIYNNTVVDSQRLVDTGFTDMGGRLLFVFNNIFSSSTERFPIALSKDSSDDPYDIGQWTSSHNIFNVSGTTILKNLGTEYNFDESMNILRDTTSFTGNPLFVNEIGSFTTPITDINNVLTSISGADYTLQAGSPAINAGDNNRNLGAFQ